MSKQGLDGLIKNLSDIMRQDAGISANIVRIEQMSWMFFLKAYDAKEQEWELMDEKYVSLIPDNCKWRYWAVEKSKDLTGEELLKFINDTLFPTLKNLPIDDRTTIKQKLPRFVFQDTNQYMKDGVLLRQVINKIEDSIDFNDAKEKHIFGDIYEKLLKSLGEAKDSGEYYTPRAVTDFMVKMINPQLGETIADFACGTGGFLTSSLNYLTNQKNTTEDIKKYNQSVYGMEKKSVPYLLCMTNMLIHDVDDPKIYHDNSLARKTSDYSKNENFDIILMNPPYGGTEKPDIQSNFPVEFRSSETADLFLYLMMIRLKPTGRAALILPNSILEATTGVKRTLKEKLFKDFNVHTIIRLPNDVFAPYTNIQTNLIFFEKGSSTKTTWFYRLDKPKGYKHFSKTKPILLEHFDDVIKWWNNREKIIDKDGNEKSICLDINKIISNNYNLNYCGFVEPKEEILDPLTIILNYKKEKTRLDTEIENILNQIEDIINDK
ncbi:MAG: N-6 DNA methylase [Mycoplasmataceae bacterium]|nr:N-6 DNA methylase [Mycoplasmataceae bacterium]